MCCSILPACTSVTLIIPCCAQQLIVIWIAGEVWRRHAPENADSWLCLQKREVKALPREGLEAAVLDLQAQLCDEQDRSAQLGQRLRKVMAQLEQAEVRPALCCLCLC